MGKKDAYKKEVDTNLCMLSYKLPSKSLCDKDWIEIKNHKNTKKADAPESASTKLNLMMSKVKL